VRVLLLDEGFVSGALTALGLQRVGCTVDVIAATGGDGGHPELLDVLSRQRGYDVVYSATEPLQQLISGARSDKRRMSAQMRAVGIPVPDEHPAASETDLRDAIRELGTPLVVKGSVGRGGKTTFIVRSLSEACRAASRIRALGADPFAQAHIHGVTHLAGGLFENGRALRFYCGAKRVQVPARTGPAAELVSTDDPAFVSVALRAFEASRVTGLASADFIRDERGTYHFLELNPRPWGSLAAARDAGVDLFTPLVALWSRQSITADLSFRPGVRSAVFPLALLSMHCWASGFAFRSAPAPRDLRLAAHLAHRLARVAYNW
jgi:predicted ATP-grasp superfamily ATP-dependent carboligase